MMNHRKFEASHPNVRFKPRFHVGEGGASMVEAAIGISLLAALIIFFVTTMLTILTAQRHQGAIVLAASSLLQPRPLVAQVVTNPLPSVEIARLSDVVGDTSLSDALESLSELFLKGANDRGFLSSVTDSGISLALYYVPIDRANGSIFLDGQPLATSIPSWRATPTDYSGLCAPQAEAELASYSEQSLQFIHGLNKPPGTVLYRTPVAGTPANFETRYVDWKPILFGVFCNQFKNTFFHFFFSREVGV